MLKQAKFYCQTALLVGYANLHPPGMIDAAAIRLL